MGSHSGTFYRATRRMKSISPWCFLVVFLFCIQIGYATDQEERPSHDIYDLRWTKRSNLNGDSLYDDRMVGKRLYDDRMIAGKRLYGDRTYGKRNGLYDYRMLN